MSTLYAVLVGYHLEQMRNCFTGISYSLIMGLYNAGPAVVGNKLCVNVSCIVKEHLYACKIRTSKATI